MDKEQEKRPERQGIIMLANIGDKLLRQLASRIKLRQVSYNGAPDKFPASLDRRLITWGIEVERVLEGGDGLGDVPAQSLKSFMHGGWRFEFGRSRSRGGGFLGSVVGPHQNLLHRIVVGSGGGSAGPALESCSHGRRRPECLPAYRMVNGRNVEGKSVKTGRRRVLSDLLWSRFRT